MKKLFLSVILMLGLMATSHACEVKYDISGEKKETYKAGEELIVEVTVVYTHRVCEIELADTKFTYDGMKILGATQWKEKSPGTYTRQVKLELLKDDKKEATLTLTRKCQKEGGIGTLKLKKE
ncbi:MAG: hypothetical protein U1C46_02545 [Bacteroidales bacterium]|nr:hypothetical protein [Bacteroidales bacterium]MDZ4203676.1 hypothetical protein [Bacteroidales bacterium]